MSKQETAIDYAVEKLEKFIPSGNQLAIEAILEQAKEMYKEQLLDMGNQFAIMGEDSPEQYYNETYESKGSDDHLPDVREMAASVQKLIDKDIFNQAILAMEEMYGSGCDAEIDAYFRGAKWMRKELNKQV